MNKYPSTMSEIEYKTFKKIAEKFDMEIEDLVSYSFCRPFLYNKTTIEKKEKVVKKFKEIVEMLINFVDVMHSTNKASTAFSDFLDYVYAAYDFLEFMDTYDDSFRIEVQNELLKAYNIYGEKIVYPGNTSDDEFIYDNLELFHIWQEYDVLFSEKVLFDQFLHNRILYPAIEDTDTIEYTLAYEKQIVETLINHFGKTDFDDSDSRVLSEDEILELYNELVPTLFRYAECVTSLVVEE